MKNQKSKKLKATPLSKMKDKHLGKRGTPERETYEAELRLEIIGEILKQAREHQNLTQAQLAKRLGINKSNISKMENNIKSIQFDTFLKVLGALKAQLTVRLELEQKTKSDKSKMKEVELVG